MSQPHKIDRRGYVKYGAMGIVAVATAGSAYYYTSLPKPIPQITTTTLELNPTTIPVRSTTTSITTARHSPLYGKAFFDYDGNGVQDLSCGIEDRGNVAVDAYGVKVQNEPAIEGAKVRLVDTTTGKNYETVTDSLGEYEFEDLKVDAGNHYGYRLLVEADRKFRFMCTSMDDYEPIGRGCNVLIDEPSQEINVGLMEGFLTLPFPEDASLSDIEYVDIDPRSPSIMAWNGGLPGYNGHQGIDFFIHIGTTIVAAAPGKVVDVVKDWKKDTRWPSSGNYVRIDHKCLGKQFNTAYCHLMEVSCSIGQIVSRGEEIGKCGNTGEGVHAPHLHFRCGEGSDVPFGSVIDPYRSLVPPLGSSLSYWTKDNDPQYPD